MTGTSPRSMAAELERRRPLPPGAGERFAGYGIMSLPFAPGHILGFRRLSASSIGPPYTSLWHRDLAGRWTLYVDVEPARACPRYFSSAIDRVVSAEIRLDWQTADRVSLSVTGHHIEWAIRVESSAVTRLANRALALLPRPLGMHPLVLDRLGPIAGWALEAGPLRMTGRAPEGQRFRMLPRRIWMASASAATVRGRDLGPIGPHGRNYRLADFVLPDRGIFAQADLWFDPRQSS